MEAKAKVKDIAISRERVTLRDVLQEGICLTNSLFFSYLLYESNINMTSRVSLKSLISP